MSGQKHSPLIRLQAARIAYDLAQEQCPHWDYDANPAPCLDTCCWALMDASQELRQAKRAANRAQS